MRSSANKVLSKGGALPLAVAAFIWAVVGMPALTSHASASATAAAMMSVAVTNNSSREIRHMYLSPVDRAEWGPDQMDGSVLKTGETFTISDATCSGNEIKVIAEDQDGCFLYGVVSCAQASNVWIITNEIPPDCGN